MLSGRRVFDGETVSHVLAAVLTKEPDWTTLPATTPAPVRKLLRRCLEKDRKRRVRDAGDVRLDIDEALTTPAGETLPAGASATPSSAGSHGAGQHRPLVAGRDPHEPVHVRSGGAGPLSDLVPRRRPDRVRIGPDGPAQPAREGRQRRRRGGPARGLCAGQAGLRLVRGWPVSPVLLHRPAHEARPLGAADGRRPDVVGLPEDSF